MNKTFATVMIESDENSELPLKNKFVKELIEIALKQLPAERFGIKTIEVYSIDASDTVNRANETINTEQLYESLKPIILKFLHQCHGSLDPGTSSIAVILTSFMGDFAKYLVTQDFSVLMSKAALLEAIDDTPIKDMIQ